MGISKWSSVLVSLRHTVWMHQRFDESGETGNLQNVPNFHPASWIACAQIIQTDFLQPRRFLDSSTETICRYMNSDADHAEPNLRSSLFPQMTPRIFYVPVVPARMLRKFCLPEPFERGKINPVRFCRKVGVVLESLDSPELEATAPCGLFSYFFFSSSLRKS